MMVRERLRFRGEVGQKREKTLQKTFYDAFVSSESLGRGGNGGKGEGSTGPYRLINDLGTLGSPSKERKRAVCEGRRKNG